MGKTFATIARIGLAIVIGFAASPAAAAENCHIGAYRLADGKVLDIGPSTGDTLRWRLESGETGSLAPSQAGGWTSRFGWTGRPDGRVVELGDCASGTLRFDGSQARRIPFQTTETAFMAGDVKLVGRLVLPPGSAKVPIVVLIHGAERDSARDLNPLQRILPAMGVGAFVYDKRGTGRSGGVYTQDFTRLARDAVLATHEARRLAGRRAGRVGYQGGSQGGWVAPIAATLEPVDFVIVSFGLAVSVIDEDQQETALEMRLKGHSDAEVAKALEVAAAAEALFESGFTTGFEELEAVEAKYRNEPWFKDVHGNFTYVILAMRPAERRRRGPEFRWGTPFRYDPMPTLAALKTPQLWVLGGQDLEAPSADTSAKLRGLIAQRRPITLALYPKAEHGMTEFETDPKGERVSTRYPAGYFAMMRDFARTDRLAPAYGEAVITRQAVGR
jgi:alpha-beta hydrolase superfamily lysophospholipase